MNCKTVRSPFELYGNHHIFHPCCSDLAFAFFLTGFFWLNEWLDFFSIFFRVLMRDSALKPVPPAICPAACCTTKSGCVNHGRNWYLGSV
jgi:hypothetical protein